MSNFTFLQPEWSVVFESASKAERMVNADPRTACFYARRTLEITVAWMFAHDDTLKAPYQDNLSAFINEPTFRNLVGSALYTKARLIKDLGNLAVHGTKKIAPSDAVNATRELFHFCFWVARTYGQRHRPAPDLKFAQSLIPASEPLTAVLQSAEQLQKLQQSLEENDNKLKQALQEKSTLDAELKQLQAEVSKAKQANQAVPDTHDYSEAQTRKAYIDLLLKEAGWDLTPERNFEVEVQGMPNKQGVGYVDYVLWGNDGKPLALIEAKRTTRSPMEGQQQAKLYADCLENAYGQRPVIFYSNGYQHWLWDDTAHPPREVQGFYKKDELELAVQRRRMRKPLSEAIVDTNIIERYYQTRAVRRVGEAFEQDKQRKALLVMATGSGKTRTVIALADVLMRSNWVKRVLFLADRVALVNQAVSAFKIHLPDASPVNLVTDKETEGRVFVSTYPTMMGLIDEARDGQRRFGVGHFDLIVIDEAHRSVYQKYRAIFKYFDSFLVGLTATPKDEVDHNTYSLFELEDGVPTDAYGLDEAVADGHLVPPVAISVPVRFQREGIRYEDLSDEEKEAWDELEWDEDGNIPDEVNAEAMNKWLFNVDTVDKVLATLMQKGQKVAGGDRLGKTIIFAKNNDHADFIAQRFNANYPYYMGHFARVVTYKTEYAQSLIDAFSLKDEMPHIAISVDMLDTGIDVPEVVNLVFFKAVRSKTKFWQMLGRGTRLCKDLYSPGEDKQSFFVFDFCQNLEFFSENPEGVEGSMVEPLSTRLFKARLEIIREIEERPEEEILDNTLNDVPLPVYVDTVQQVRRDFISHLHETVQGMNVDNFIVRPHRRHVEKFAQNDAWETLSAEDFYDLRNEVAGLPSAMVDDDEEAKRFDMLVLRTELAILQAQAGFSGLQQNIQAIANALEEQVAIPAIKAEIVFIQAVASDEWWQDVTVPMLEMARRKLRRLVKLIPKAQKKVVYTDFEDEIGDGDVVDLPQVTAGLNMAKFRDKARQFLRQHESHLALQRLKRNIPLTPGDLVEFEAMLKQAGGSPELIKEAAEKSHGLGAFIRSLVGLEREAAMEAFSEFIKGGTATANQIEFINLIVLELVQNGMMEPSRLFESPYTNLHAQGPLGIFKPEEVKRIVKVLTDINETAQAA
ncbi:type III restriction protein [Alcaligenes faecalis]|uniref:DEAD/DEAH box helicase family protein n=1 Tax=Alcaligenes faecalis TaxID=511 RepID=UPI0007C47212|nr:DEAD/DEAH box helicase family protein [Alcaligenes faecalis]ARP54248.1 type III restriction protein [Alcaligenes faecalis]